MAQATFNLYPSWFHKVNNEYIKFKDCILITFNILKKNSLK